MNKLTIILALATIACVQLALSCDPRDEDFCGEEACTCLHVEDPDVDKALTCDTIWDAVSDSAAKKCKKEWRECMASKDCAR